ncbi:MAG: hypothetical protein D3923_03620, partial [Candidatus Electrothrix sp. AR3]|nr:hypothetical protein [Candidatus Electrothrix sp. AR3]
MNEGNICHVIYDEYTFFIQTKRTNVGRGNSKLYKISAQLEQKKKLYSRGKNRVSVKPLLVYKISLRRELLYPFLKLFLGELRCYYRMKKTSKAQA